MYCKNCGALVDSHDQFCQNCGIKVKSEIAPNYFQNLLIEKIKKCTKLMSISKNVFISVTVILFLAIFIMYFCIMDSIVSGQNAIEFFAGYGLLFLYFLINAIIVISLINKKHRQLSELLTTIQLDYDIEKVDSQFNNLKTSSLLVTAIILTITSSIIISTPLFLSANSISDLKKFYIQLKKSRNTNIN